MCALLPFCALALSAAPLGHDLPLELTRIAAYRASLLDGQFPPYWAGELYGGMGSPIFLFYGHVFLALSSALSFVSGSYTRAALLAQAIATVVGALALQRTAAELRLSPAAQRVAVYAYVLNPYLLGDVLLRNANTEYTALCLLPIALLGVARADALLVGVGAALVICAHPLVALFLGLCCPCIAGVERKRWCALAGGAALALVLSAWTWLPVLAYGSSVQREHLLRGKLDFHHNFVNLAELVGTDSFYAPGPLPLMAAAGALLLARRERWVLAVGAGVVLLAALQLTAAAPLWETVRFAKYLQFPWRLMGPLALLGALAAAYVFEHMGRRWLEPLVLVACLGVALPQLLRVRLVHARVVETSLRLDDLASQARSATVGDEYLPQGAARALADVPARDRPLIASADVAVRTLVDEPRWLLLDVDMPHEEQLCVARWQFELWQLKLDARELPIVASEEGCLALHVPAGRHRIEATLSVPSWRAIGLLVSAVSLAALGIELRRRRQQRVSSVRARPNQH